jgi:hypothetical protein
MSTRPKRLKQYCLMSDCVSIQQAISATIK